MPTLSLVSMNLFETRRASASTLFSCFMTRISISSSVEHGPQLIDKVRAATYRNLPAYPLYQHKVTAEITIEIVKGGHCMKIEIILSVF